MIANENKRYNRRYFVYDSFLFLGIWLNVSLKKDKQRKKIIMIIAVFLCFACVCHADELIINNQSLTLLYGPDHQQFCLMEYDFEFKTDLENFAIVKFDLFLGSDKMKTIYQLAIGETTRTLNGYWYVPSSWAWRPFIIEIDIIKMIE